MSWFSTPVATVAISMKPVSGPWGGSSPFVWQLKSFLEGRGYAVRFDFKRDTDLILLIDPREDLQGKAFGPLEIAEYKRRNPRVRVLHRVNECDQRKNSNFMDELLRGANQLADHTVFIAEWLRDYFFAKWFERTRPHTVIYNGASVRDFHPVGAAQWDGKEPMRVVTHHWSDNPLKGFDVYEEVDRLLAAGELPGFEQWVIGRWPKTITWKASKTFPPAHGTKLGAQLRECHLYLTATRWEPCGMHHVEGAQCGLPLVYHLDGGGVVEAGERYGLGFRENVKAALIEARDRYAELRAKVLAVPPSGDRMCLEYGELIQRLLVDRG
jgi:glycosyltransferase involved in cell wall biosynthesis